ncbi:MAG TPA: 1,2-phenylacetyl-CoA epoxidase subunit PaaC [Trebonia sp.]|jgi:ring-1,2-phenylacetyl-CoA epoxidase subunit PaaC|nr:1,2-phenylacetyl-CoA epoxidase subunit PaaC [Trebonia sp.]
MDDDNPYDLLAADDEDQRWAFGTGFTDPFAGVGTALPPGVPAKALARYCLALGDDALIYSHRLQEWVTRMPELEEETAIANIALDLLGQARLLLSRAAFADPSLGPDGLPADEDRLAFFRAPGQFRNVRFAERADADFAELMARLLVFSAWRLELCAALRACPDPVVAAITARSVSELTYHRDYAAAWVVRLGDGTGYSRARMREGLAAVGPLTGELFTASAVERDLPGVAVDPGTLRAGFDSALGAVLDAATLDAPAPLTDAPLAPAPLTDAPLTDAPLTDAPQSDGPLGRDGAHTPALSRILAELQSVARAHPDATW